MGVRCRCRARSASWGRSTTRARHCAWRWPTSRRRIGTSGIPRWRCNHESTSLHCLRNCGMPAAQPSYQPEPIRKLKPMLDGVEPIANGERAARVEKARRLMRVHKMSAIYLESGASMYYFTGKREPGQAWILPARGEAVWTPAEAAKAAQSLRDLGIATGAVGMEELVRFGTYDGLRREAPALEALSATPVTAGCRMIKSAAEIALLQLEERRVG